MDEDFRRRLVAIDEELGRVPLPRGLEARVLGGRATHRGASGWLVLAGAGAAAVLAFAIGRQSAPPPDPVALEGGAISEALAHGDPVPVPHEPSRDACPSTLGIDDATLLPLGCTVSLSEPGMAIAAHTPARLVRTPTGVRVLEGDAFFAVEKVKSGAPTVRVAVGGGTIEVLGTRFVVHQADAEGHVDLLEGAIAFTADDGTRRAVEPGHRLRWAAGSIVEDDTSHEAGHSESATKKPHGDAHDTGGEPAVALDAVLDEVATLRRRGEYREAATLLRNTRASIRDRSASEILSYEEGTLREHYQPQEAACAFWRGHMRRFGEHGRYASAVTGRSSRLGCTE